VLRQLLLANGFVNPTVFGEHPTLGMNMGYARVPLFRLGTSTLNLVMRAIGLPGYVIWSPSMWGVGSRNQ
jgi:hypothetical protein